MQIAKHLSQGPENLNPELRLTISTMPGVEQNFPIDEWGQFSLTFRKKVYKFQPYLLRYSQYLKNLFAQSSNEKELTIALKYGQSEKAFDLMMKLLFGFKDVAIPKEEFIQFLIILEELGKKSI